MALIDLPLPLPRLSFRSLVARLFSRPATPSSQEKAQRAAAANAHREALRRDTDRLLRKAGGPFF